MLPDLMPIQINAFRMSDEEFIRFCEDNPQLRLERTADLQIVIISPSFSCTGYYHSVILARLFAWNQTTLGGLVFDSSSAFFLPDRSMRMPDVSWMSKEVWNSIPEEDKDKFLHACPEFVVEVKSKSDRTDDLKVKMESWIKNGARLAWLINPEAEKAWVYRGNGSISEISDFKNSLKGEDVLPGFIFELHELRLV